MPPNPTAIKDMAEDRFGREQDVIDLGLKRDRLAVALSAAIRRLETIRETEPHICLDHDIEVLERELKENSVTDPSWAFSPVEDTR